MINERNREKVLRRLEAYYHHRRNCAGCWYWLRCPVNRRFAAWASDPAAPMTRQIAAMLSQPCDLRVEAANMAEAA